MTDNEIIKALECSPLNDIGGCRKIDALSLINRQKAEIEKWKKAQERTKGTLEIVLKNKDDRTIELEKAIKESIEFVKKQGELIEQLKAENDIHVKERAKDIFKFTELTSEINLLKMEKSEAIKEFAERANEKLSYYLEKCGEFVPYGMADIIDNVAKEMTEDEGK